MVEDLKEELSDYPISRVIDVQLSSIWSANMDDEIDYDAASAFNIDYENLVARSSADIEDILIDAIDRKSMIKQKAEEVVRVLKEIGFTNPEISEILNCHEYKVIRYIRKLKKSRRENK